MCVNRFKARVAGIAVATAASLTALGAAVPAGATPVAPARAAPAPFVIIMMENHGLRPVLNDRTDMPYLNSLWRGGTSLDFTHYAALAHPSLPNYLGMASGFTQTGADAVHPGEFAGPTVWDQLTQAGVSWGIFEEGMPTACSPSVTYNDPVTDGQYLLRHDPGIPFGTVYQSAECQQVQPLTALNDAQLASTGFANCLKGSDALEQRSDQWLSQIVPKLTAAGATVFITFDECCAATLSPMYALETGPAVTPGSDGTSYSHYSVLAGIENAYGLSLLGGAASANLIPVP